MSDSQKLVLAEPFELIIQPCVVLDDQPKSNIIRTAVAFRGLAYSALFMLRPPQVLMVEHKGAPVDNRLESTKHLLSLLEGSAEKLANQLLTGNVEGVPNEPMVQAVSESQAEVVEDP